MLSPRLTNCVECTTIPALINDIDCKLAEMANNLYNNVVFMLNQPVQGSVIIDLLNYRRILTYKYCNPDYAGCFTVPMIASRVKLLTIGNKFIPRPSCSTTTTTTTTPISTTTTTTDPYYYYTSNQYTCPNCSAPSGVNTIIKSLTPLTVGNWIPLSSGGNLFMFNVLSVSVPNYMATLVNGSGALQTCGCQ